jgi:hypothetical protein
MFSPPLSVIWKEDDATLKALADRGEPVITTVYLNDVKVKRVMLTAEALWESIAKTKATAEAMILATAARGVSPRDMNIEVWSRDIAPRGPRAAAVF